MVYAGTLGKINGVAYLAELAAHARTIDPELRFLVVGSELEEPLIRHRAEELGILDQTFFVRSGLAKDQMPELLSASTLATSLFIDLEPMWANSANKFFDALAARRPVAINYGGWQAEVLRESGAGIVLSPGDLRQAAEKLVATVHDPEGLAVMRGRAASLARREFSRDVLFGRFRDVLRAAAG